MYNASTLETYYDEDFSNIDEVMGAASWSFHRVDLHRGLQALAASSPRHGEGEIEIQLGVSARTVDCDKGLVALEGGDELQADLVVVADGAHVSRATFYPWP